MIQSEPEYAGKTTMFILPDFGVTRIRRPAAMAFNITVPAMSFPGPHG